jgi:hypothetical protein
MQAFALTAEYQGTLSYEDEDGKQVEVQKFRGASISGPEGEHIDVGQLLQDGGGTIVTADPRTAVLLGELDCLKEVGVPEDAAPTTAPLEAQRIQDLRALPEAMGIERAGAMRKPELIARIQLAQQGEDPNQPLASDFSPDPATEPEPEPTPPHDGATLPESDPA